MKADEPHFYSAPAESGLPAGRCARIIESSPVRSTPRRCARPADHPIHKARSTLDALQQREAA